MESIKNKLIRFMTGRYGIDQLYYAGLFLALGLMMINMMVNSTILMVISNGLILLMVLRGFSRNISRRRSENEQFLKLWNPVKKSGRIFLRQDQRNPGSSVSEMSPLQEDPETADQTG
ncbi:hypothetical protein [Acetobacterium wieringae]|uniref:hypothetical protein n=1 Tax=Acetobacterium wieringae TaxID=52694 RepID=UPI0020348875|nr:hypothetical protein [Acetobacterium wieringae]URN84545.1 hypothetical protein CHL1_000110 [Acetobacterium wieringae]